MVNCINQRKKFLEAVLRFVQAGKEEKGLE
jgi:hypothetical protein